MSPDKLNDSFELDLDRIKFEMTDENVRSLATRYFPGDIERQQKLFEDSKINRDLVPNALKEELGQVRSKSGVCCFTTHPCNKLMWANYGQSDAGICVGFLLPPVSPRENELFIMKIIYEKERSFINYFDAPFKIFPKWAFIKNSEWEYENEFRPINMARNGLHRFDRESIKEIHYGIKTKQEDIGKIEAFLALKDYSTYDRFRIQQSKSNYNLESVKF